MTEDTEDIDLETHHAHVLHDILHRIQLARCVCAMDATIHPIPSPLSASEAMNDTTNYLIIDTGGGKLATITQQAWHMTATHFACSLI